MPLKTVGKVIYESSKHILTCFSTGTLRTLPLVINLPRYTLGRDDRAVCVVAEKADVTELMVP